jgi:hypothetical protein
MGHLSKIKCVDSRGECEHFSFNKCLIYTHDGASAKFNTNSHKTDNSVEELYPCSPLGVDSTDTSQLPKEKNFAWTIPIPK